MNISQNHKNDVFAEIAAQRTVYRTGNLVEPSPPVLPEKYLPSENNPEAAFTPAEQIDTPEKLQVELKKAREQYKPFLENLSPSLQQTRQTLPLEDFDWRIETEADKKDFPSVLGGNGQWEQVKVPHYGEPLGLAATYYRTTFNITQSQLDKGAAFICFKGVDYKAHVFINGSYIGSHEGFFAPFEFDFTDCARIGENTLVVKVENDFIMGGNKAWNGEHCGDKIYAATGLGYDEPYYGWHHCPPGMGIYQDVRVEYRSRIFISDIFVRPLPQQQAAHVNIEVHSCDVGEKAATIRLSLFGQNFDEVVFKNLEYHPKSDHISGLNDDLNIAFAKANGTYNKPIPLYIEKGKNTFCIPIRIDNPRIWEHKSPWLYQIQAEILDENKTVVDSAKQHFGMRSFRIDENCEPKGSFYLNEQPIRLRGANTMGHEQQCVFKKDFAQLIDDILLAKICNMNFLRLTQRPVQPEVYDYCDMLGLLTQTDLPTFGCITKTQYNEALKQVAEMEKLVRCHPCNILASYINEPFPNGKNKPHRNISRQEMEDFFHAADNIIKHLNPDRVTKPCDGDYDPPSPGLQDRHCYATWYNGQGLDIGRLIKGYWQPTKKGWNYGCGEFGAEALERTQVMRKYYPTSWLPQSDEQQKSWTPDKIFKAQTGKFHYFFFDSQNHLEDWVEQSQNHQARALKTMTEAFRRDNKMVSIAVHLFIDAFPSGWMKTIMDCERHPKKGYFAYRNALAPLLASIRTDRTKFFAGENMRFEAWLSNDTPEAAKGLSLHYQIEDGNKVLFSQKANAKLEVCKSTFQGFIQAKAPDVDQRKTLVVRIALIDTDGKIVNQNSTIIEVFPEISSNGLKATIIGDAIAKTLANELGIETVDQGKSNTIFIDDYAEYKDNEEYINALVADGATAVFMPFEKEMIYEICGSSVDVKTSRFNPLHFVSRKTGHPLVEGFEQFDFSYWYDEYSDMIVPVIDATFTADDFQPMLTAGNADEKCNWVQVVACGEKKHGKGRFIVNQIKLAGRVKTNPTAKQFAMKLSDFR